MDATGLCVMRAQKPPPRPRVPPVASKPKNLPFDSSLAPKPDVKPKQRRSPPKPVTRTVSSSDLEGRKNSQGNACASLKEESKSPKLSPSATRKLEHLGVSGNNGIVMQLSSLQQSKEDTERAEVKIAKKPVSRTCSVDKLPPIIPPRSKANIITRKPSPGSQGVKQSSPLSTKRHIAPTQPAVVLVNKTDPVQEDDVYQIPDPDSVNISSDDVYEIPISIALHQPEGADDDTYQIPDIQSMKIVQDQFNNKSVSTPDFHKCTDRGMAPPLPSKLPGCSKRIVPPLPPSTPPPRLGHANQANLQLSETNTFPKQKEMKPPQLPPKTEGSGYMKMKGVADSHTHITEDGLKNTETMLKRPQDTMVNESINLSHFSLRGHSNSCPSPIPPPVPPHKTQVVVTSSLSPSISIGEEIDLELMEEDEEDYIDMTVTQQQQQQQHRIMSDSQFPQQVKESKVNPTHPPTERQCTPNFTHSRGRHENEKLGHMTHQTNTNNNDDDGGGAYETIDLTRPVPPPRRNKKQQVRTAYPPSHHNTPNKKPNKIVTSMSVDAADDNYVIMRKK